MKELINRLMALGITEEQAISSITIIKDFAKEKMPLFSGAIEKMFGKYNTKEEADFID